ncbi:MAG TPA: hypothetical protein VIN74_10090 [Candidatus Limnocylindria bacterium]|jgi:hypothetical protein
MTSGSLTDLDPAPAPERRWPFYLAWTVGGLVVGAVLFTHLPATLLPADAPVVAPEPSAAPVVPQLPGPPRLLIPLPLRDTRLPVVPARP